LIAAGAALAVGLLAFAGARASHDEASASGSFCAQLDEAATLSQALGTSSDAGADDLARVADAFVALENAAPADIKPEVAMVTDFIVALSEAPAHDPEAVQAILARASTPEFISATETVGAYADTECGIVPPAFQ
jgi:hypothetical protein